MTTPLTRSQEGVVHAHLASGLAARYRVGELVELDGVADLAALAEAVTTAVTEAEVHRLRVDADGAATTGPVGLDADRLRAGLVDLSGAADPLGAALAWARERMGTGLELGAGPLHDHRLLLLGPGRVAWFASTHHVLMDGYALVLLVRRALEVHAAVVAHREVPAGRFTPTAAVVEAERAYEASAAHARDLAHWTAAEDRAVAAGAVRGLVAPQAPGSGTVRLAGAPSVDWSALTGAAARLGVDWPTLVATAHAVSLARLARARDVVVGVPLMNRLGVAALAPVSVVNVLPLHLTVRPADPVGGLLAEVAAGLAGLRRHGRFRHEELARLTGRVGGPQPLVGAELNLKVFDAPETYGPLRVRLHNLAEGPVDDAGLSVYRDADGLRWEATAPASTPDATLVLRALTETLDATLTGLAAAGGATPVGLLASASASASARSTLTGPAASPRPPLVGALLRALVRRHPDRVALVDEDRRLTYADLGTRAARLASALRRRCPVTTAVTLEVPRGADAVVALLAALCAGRTVVPVDPTWPDVRRAELRAGLGAHLVLDAAELSRLESAGADPSSSAAASEVEDVDRHRVAYVVHTSGSTGRPKGVAVTQDALAHFLAHHRATTFAAVADEAVPVAQTLPLEFDGCWDTLQAVLLGHTLHVLPRRVVRDPAATVAAVRDGGLQVLDTTPTVLAALLDEGLLAPGHPLRMVSVGGEACPPALWRRLLDEPGLQVANYYGPTEATVDACGVLVLPGTAKPGSTAPTTAARAGIGRPLTGFRAHVLDEHLAPVPAGWPGELYLAGPQLALGYLGQPGQTAARFVADPAGPGERLYRTGDLVSVAADGSLDYRGRVDDQVKVRGYRVEPAEVEAGLRRLDGVAHAAVGVRQGRLVAAVVPRPGTALAAGTVRERASAQLPEHLVPTRVVVVDALPRTTTGKLDLAALPDESETDPGREEDRDPPRTPAEVALATTVAAALGLEPGRLSRSSNFFALGGDSITAIGVVSRLRRAGWSTTVSELFTHQTVARTAQGLVPHTDAGPSARPTTDAPSTGLDAAQLEAVHALVSRRRRRPERTP